MAIDIFVDSRATDLPTAKHFEPWIAAALAVAGEAFDDSALSLCLRVVDEAEGRELNLAYRQRDHATNVLSFAGEVAIPGCRHIGDVIICAPVVQRESEEQGKSAAAHFAHMSMHGCLHLLGFDHQDDEEARQMEALEVQALGQLGLPDPYQSVSNSPESILQQEACGNG